MIKLDITQYPEFEIVHGEFYAFKKFGETLQQVEVQQRDSVGNLEVVTMSASMFFDLLRSVAQYCTIDAFTCDTCGFTFQPDPNRPGFIKCQCNSIALFGR